MQNHDYNFKYITGGVMKDNKKEKKGDIRKRSILIVNIKKKQKYYQQQIQILKGRKLQQKIEMYMKKNKKKQI